jgi:hypothetical protein
MDEDTSYQDSPIGILKKLDQLHCLESLPPIISILPSNINININIKVKAKARVRSRRDMDLDYTFNPQPLNISHLLSHHSKHEVLIPLLR